MWGSWERTQLHFRLASTLPLHTGGWRSVSVSLSETRLMAFSFCVSVPAVFIRALGNNVKRLSELTDPRQLPAAEQEEEDTLFTVGPSVKSIYLWLWLCRVCLSWWSDVLFSRWIIEIIYLCAWIINEKQSSCDMRWLLCLRIISELCALSAANTQGREFLVYAVLKKKKKKI